MDLNEAYRVLSLRKEDATPVLAKSSYRRLALRHHPDKNPGREEEAKIEFQRISCAYSLVRNHLLDGTNAGSNFGAHPSWEEAKDFFRETFGMEFDDAVAAAARVVAVATVGVAVVEVGVAAVEVGVAAAGLVAAAATVAVPLAVGAKVGVMLGDSMSRASLRLSSREKKLARLRGQIKRLEQALENDRNELDKATRNLRNFVAAPYNNVVGLAHHDLEKSRRLEDEAKTAHREALRDLHAFQVHPNIPPEDVPHPDEDVLKVIAASLCIIYWVSYDGMYIGEGESLVGLGSKIALAYSIYSIVFVSLRCLGKWSCFKQVYLQRWGPLDKRVSVSAAHAATCSATVAEIRIRIKDLLLVKIKDAESDVAHTKSMLQRYRADLADADSALGAVGAMVGFGSFLGDPRRNMTYESDVIQT